MTVLSTKPKFYSLKNILSKNAQYNIIFGERSNGKTYSVLKYALDKWKEDRSQLAIVRRWQEDFKGKRGANLYNALVENGEISKATNGEYDSVYYYSNRWYFAKFDEKLQRRIISDEPFAFAFSLSNMEHDKSVSYPRINTIVFDEFITRETYQVDEFVVFTNVISTIVRYRDNVKIFMLGNTVNQYCPYFKEMGLKHISKMNKGDIDVYTYGDSKLRVAVEYADSPNKRDGKPSDVYFAFDNPKLNMITGGAWEIDLYPHCPFKYKPKDILFRFYIIFEIYTLQCNIIQNGNDIILFIHRKTTPIKDEENDLVYTTEYDPRPNWRRNIMKPQFSIEKKISTFFRNDKVFYQDNEVGEIVRNYLLWCKSV